MIVASFKTDYGECAVTNFGLGLKFGSRYTSATILSACAKALQTIPEDARADVSWCDEFNDYAWIPWARMNGRYAIAMQYRMQKSTRSSIKLDDSDSYLGIGRYQDVWPEYITTSSRMLPLLHAFGSVQNARILELGCGTGHQLVALSAYDADVYGMELNPRLYAERHKLLAKRVLFGDALLDPFVRFRAKFDAVIVSMLGFVDTVDLAAFFTNLSHIIEDTGVLVLDTFKTPSSGNLLNISTYKTIAASCGFVPKLAISEPQQLICKKV